MNTSDGAPVDPVDILIVDDKVANIVSLEAVLRRGDYNLVSVTSGQEGLKHVLNRDFAVILLDVMMPEMDGFEFARLLRKRNRTNPTPIVFLTAIATDFRHLVEGYQVGAVDYLQKPLDPEIVKAKVAVFVDLFRKNLRIKRQEAELREIQRLESERRIVAVRQAGERHYAELAEAIPQIVWSADATLRLTYLNRRWTELTGVPAAAALASEALRHSAYHPDDLPNMEKVLEASRQTGAPLDCEVRLRQAAGRWRWQLLRGSPERAPGADGATGPIIGWHGTLTDIHHHKRIERAQRFLAETNMLFTSASDYRQALATLAKKVVSAFADGCVVDLAIPGKPFRRYVAVRDGLDASALSVLSGAGSREEAEALLGCALGNCRPTLLADGQGLAPLATAAKLDLNSVASAPIEIRGGDAGAISFFTVGSCALDANDLDLVVETCRHIAIAVENALVREESEDNVKRKDEFLATLSHELRTPLNAVIGWAQLLRMEQFTEEAHNGLDAIERNAKSLAQLVGDLLDVSRIITGKMDFVLKPLDLNAFLRNLCESLRPLAADKGLALTCELPERSLLVAGDQRRLQQVFWNLLTNAIKFTPEGGAVRLELASGGGRAAVRVKDTGIGIDRAILPYVFERFRQADSSRTRRHGGLGLGLSIVKHLVEKHDGSVEVQSDGDGKGTEFTVFLPLFREAEADADRRPAPQPLRAQSNLGGVDVLLVDDDASSRTLTATFLKFGGATVRAAGSVREAVAQLELKVPDVVLTDIGMPGEDGFELLDRVKALRHGRGQGLPIAALTAYASPEDAEKAIAAGFDRYLTKPIQVGDLIAAVSAMTGRAPPAAPVFGASGFAVAEAPARP